jgi:(p)ppGpp synthase/HD superfamily hydrolase
MTLDPLVMDARRFAKLAHTKQKRKYTGQPYFIHVDRVGTRLHKMGFAAHIAAAGFCHDTMEDCGISFGYLERALGEPTAWLVHHLTNPSKRFPAMRREQRKQMDRLHIASCSNVVRVVKLVDRIDNLRDMSLAPRPFLRLYADESRLLLNALRGTHAQLEREMDSVLTEIERTCGVITRPPFAVTHVYEPLAGYRYPIGYGRGEHREDFWA